MKLINPCPFCGEEPKYSKLKVCCNYNHLGLSGGKVMKRNAEEISCNNVKKCDVRPSLRRIESNDAIEIWNRRPQK